MLSFVGLIAMQHNYFYYLQIIVLGMEISTLSSFNLFLKIVVIRKMMSFKITCECKLSHSISNELI